MKKVNRVQDFRLIFFAQICIMYVFLIVLFFKPAFSIKLYALSYLIYLRKFPLKSKRSLIRVNPALQKF